MAKNFDPITVVERAYDLAEDDRTWMSEVLRALEPGLPRELGFGASRVRLLYGRLTVVDSVSGPSEEPESRRAVDAAFEVLPEAVRTRILSPVPSLLAFSQLGAAGDQMRFRLAEATLRLPPESFGLLTSNGVDEALIVAAWSDRPRRPTPSEERRLGRVLIHVAGALRLRTRLRRRATEPLVVLDPMGNALHAEPSSRAPGLLETLRGAVRAAERARGALRRRAPEESLDLWKGLVAGSISVVDWVDTDGRRYLVAHENPWSIRGLSGLTPRESDVAEFLRHGRSNSEIAYALGLSVGTVNRLAREVFRKWGAAERADVARFFGGSGRVEVLDPELGIFQVATDEAPRKFAEMLSPAEQEVARLALAGCSNAEIARQRGTAVRTVANQLAAVYARFGVRGRIELATVLPEFEGGRVGGTTGPPPQGRPPV